MAKGEIISINHEDTNDKLSFPQLFPSPFFPPTKHSTKAPSSSYVNSLNNYPSREFVGQGYLGRIVGLCNICDSVCIYALHNQDELHEHNLSKTLKKGKMPQSQAFYNTNALLQTMF